MNRKTTFPQTAGPLMRRIGAACEGLSFMSETDAEVRPFFGGHAAEVSADAVGKAAGEKQSEQPEEIDLDQFFERLTARKKWHSGRRREMAERFGELRDLLKSELSDLKVFRFGRVRIRIYVAGLDEQGHLAGVSTEAVET